MAAEHRNAAAADHNNDGGHEGQMNDKNTNECEQRKTRPEQIGPTHEQTHRRQVLSFNMIQTESDLDLPLQSPECMQHILGCTADKLNGSVSDVGLRGTEPLHLLTSSWFQPVI